MSKRKRLARERLEYYATMSINLLGSIAALIPAIYLLLLSDSYNTTVHTAQLGAWIGTRWRKDD